MKQMKIIYHRPAIRLLENIIDDTPVKTSGTYNRQEPTYYEKGERVFEYKGIPFSFEYYDVTWGIEITVSRITYWPDGNSVWKHVRVGGFYLERDRVPRIILRQPTSKGLFCLLAKAFPECMKPNFKGLKTRRMEEEMEKDNEMWIDPAGGVHFGYEDDPAAMYE